MDNLHTVFTVTPQDLGALGPEAAVDLFRELLWAEATHLGIGRDFINVPTAIDVADAGIDAEIDRVPDAGGHGLFGLGLTRFQIKTGGFKLTTKTNVREVLFVPKSLGRGKQPQLQPRIKACLEKGGTLAVVTFGWDGPETGDDQIRGLFIDELVRIDPKYADAKLRFIRQNNLMSFLEPFPSLALRARGIGAMRVVTHDRWASQDDMRKPLVLGPQQDKFISELRDHLRNAGQSAVHVRVIGEAGIGKTRLVLEATGARDLLPLVLYATADSFLDSPLMTELLRTDNHYSVVLVVDECDTDARARIWRQFKAYGSRLKIVTIYNEPETTSGTTVYMSPPGLDKEHISEIIQRYGMDKPQADRWADLCGESPRVAHVIGENLRNNPADLLRSPDTVNIWDRFVCGADDPKSPDVRDRRLVLRHLALFRKFGVEEPVKQEALAIAELIRRVDPNITDGRFWQIIGDLRNRRILQGESTLYITPKALHIWMWREWWNNYGPSLDLDSLYELLPDELLRWFEEMFEYAQASEAAIEVVRRLLGPGGMFEKNAYLTSREGGRLFFALSAADPEAALRFLSKTIPSGAGVEQFAGSLREIVWSLQRIAVWRELFGAAAEVLLTIAEVEPKPSLVNAADAFAKLFAVGPGPVAATQASFDERLPILVAALKSGSAGRRLVALRACDHALETQFFTRAGNIEYQGVRPTPQLWAPSTFGELFDAYRKIWELLRSAVRTLPESERLEAMAVLLKRAREIASIPSLSPLVLDTIGGLARSAAAPPKELLSTVLDVVRYEEKNLDPSLLAVWRQLESELVGSGFSAELRRYVGMDRLEDKFDERGEIVDDLENRISRLASAALSNPDLLMPEIGWLTTATETNVFTFGYQLGLKDEDLRFLPSILKTLSQAAADANPYLASGYLRALAGRDREKWESWLDRLASDPSLVRFVPQITAGSGLSDRAAERILSVAQLGQMSVSGFVPFGFGGLITALSPVVFEKWLHYLIDQTEKDAAQIGLQLSFYYYIYGDEPREIPEQLIAALLSHQSLFERSGAPLSRPMVDHYWQSLALRLAAKDQMQGVTLARKVLEHLGEDGTIAAGYHSPVQAFLTQMLRERPAEMWALIAERLGPPIDARAMHIRQWLHGELSFRAEQPTVGALELIPPTLVWDWVDANVERRAWYLASFVPNRLFREDGRICWAREVLIRYGDREDVRRNLSANFSTEGWWGSETEHLWQRIHGLMEHRGIETEPRVVRWIDEYVDHLRLEMERARVREEREE